MNFGHRVGRYYGRKISEIPLPVSPYRAQGIRGLQEVAAYLVGAAVITAGLTFGSADSGLARNIGRFYESDGKEAVESFINTAKTYFIGGAL